ncbi:MAG: matrixin family metalloprotease [Acidobacteria bacterium]|nr:matrixin family metalloprotease [Acidobacteriota bacterium]
MMKLAAIRTLARITAAAVLFQSANFAYYHFTRYAANRSPFNAIPAKFDLSALPDKTVSYFVNEAGPANLAATDSFAALLTQIRSAARVWNGVETSELRVRFGGLAPKDATSNAATPSIEIDFQDLPPGVRGFGGPTVFGDVVNSTSGAFLPIQRSVIVLPRDMADRGSWTDRAFGTLVHEFGHALGLQHSFVSGAMATEITRSTTKIRPITPDDVAGISILYPTAGFRENLGAISGRVAAGNAGIGLASVVAISPGGAAISTLTQPDGTYRIEGVPAGNYFLYAHPLPPAIGGQATPGDVVLPIDLSINRPAPGGQQFDTTFYPASRTPFITVRVDAGASVDGTNFSVSLRNSPTALHSIEMFSFPGQRDVKPAHSYTAGARNLVVMTGPGLFQGTQPAAGLQISAIGGAVSIPSVRPYLPAPTSYLQMDVQFGQFVSESFVHLIFARNNDIFVLPYGLRVADRQPPQIESISPRNENGEVVVAGTGLSAATRITFDGVAATVRGFDEAANRLTVVPPVGALGLVSHVAAYNADGQSSQFMQAATNWTYDFGEPQSAVPPAPQISATSLPAGTESVIEFTGNGFADGTTSIGFGSADILVRRVWFPSTTRGYANVYVAANAAGNSYNVSVLNGLRLATQPGQLQVTQPSARTAWLTAPSNGFVAGSTASLVVNGWTFTSASAVQLTIGERPVAITSVDGSTIHFTVPANLQAGPVVVRVQQGAEAALPLAVPAAPLPAIISSVTAGFGQPITEQRPARPGELMTLTVTGLPENLAPPGSQPRVTITIGSIEHRLLSVTPGGSTLQAQFIVLPSVAFGTPQILLTVDGLAVQPFSLPLRAF